MELDEAINLKFPVLIENRVGVIICALNPGTDPFKFYGEIIFTNGAPNYALGEKMCDWGLRYHKISDKTVIMPDGEYISNIKIGKSDDSK